MQAISTPPSASPRLPMARYLLEYRALDPVRLPAYAGSAWRGALGYVLKQLACVTRADSCGACLLQPSCPYSYLFETPPDPGAGKLTRYTAAPHPFVLVLDQAGSGARPAGAALYLGLGVFGAGNRHLPYLIHALDQVGQRGVGHGRGRLRLEQVLQAGAAPAEPWRAIYRPGGTLESAPPAEAPLPPCPAAVALRIHTPLRLRVDGAYLGAAELRAGHLLSNLLRRISLLTTFHTDTPLETDFAALTRIAEGVELQSEDLHWYDWERYSSRQGTLIKMGGLIGGLRLSGPGLPALWPYLWLGQWTHAGKGAVMGLGRYSIEDQ